jgi:hypothetical protein
MEEKVPTCKCGCGRAVKYNKRYKRFNITVQGHRTKKDYIITYQNNLITKFLIESPKFGKIEVIVDTEEWDWIKNRAWHLQPGKRNGEFYAYSARDSSLQKILLGIKGTDICIDHINHNSLDNRKSNLRICSPKENCRNSRKPNKKNSTSKYKGVFYSKGIKKFMSVIGFDNKSIHLGVFLYEINAALAYNKAAIKLYGKFAYLNDLSNIKEFPKEPNKKIKTSKYRGVYYSKSRKKYVSVTNKKNKKFHLGCFKNEIDAAHAYNKAAIKYHGAKAKLNIIPEELPCK